MKSIVAGVLASIATIGLLSACGSDDKVAIPTASTDVAGLDITIPDGITIPAGGLPSNATVPEAMIDQMITQLEAAGMKVDKDCFKKLLADEELRNVVAAGGAPSQEAIQKYLSCVKP